MGEHKDQLISVVMPAYNCERFVDKAIESVINQSYSHWELIVVDDCSKDATAAVAEKYASLDSRIRVIRQPKNQGVAETRNIGISEATGEYVALLDSDDVWARNKLELQHALLCESHASIAYCSYDFIDENDQPIGKPFLVPPTTDFNKMLGRSVISCSTVMADTALMKAHPFDNKNYHEDYVLWMELLTVPVEAVGVREVLASYRQLSTSRSHNKKNAAKHRWRIYRDVLHLSLPRSACAFISYAVQAVIKYYF